MAARKSAQTKRRFAATAYEAVIMTPCTVAIRKPSGTDPEKPGDVLAFVASGTKVQVVGQAGEYARLANGNFVNASVLRKL